MSEAHHPRVVETHISTLFFADDRVYKLAKRLDLPFLQTTDVDDRLRLAARELELNQRFAPDVYLGTADVTEADRVVDRMIVMRRLPSERQLTALLLADDVSIDDVTQFLRDVARRIAIVHQSGAARIDRNPTSTARLARNWNDNFDAISHHVGTIIDRSEFDAVRRLAEAYIAQSDDLRTDRTAEGFVRDGHGDLTADDIYCLDDGPRILDCLAFDDALRTDDILNDIAFLAMDVHRLAGASAAQTLMNAYHEFTNEQHPPSLAHHYVAYRAHVRAKIACLRVEQGDTDSADLARTYHSLAHHHLERAQLRLILVGGGPGVGKTMLADRLADHYGYVHLATDEIRHDVAGIPHGQHAFAAFDQGAYDPAVVEATYAEQRHEAVELLHRGHGVVLDASWASAERRYELRRAADLLHVDVAEIQCTLDASIARERIARRLANPDNPSDATPDLVDLVKFRRDPWPHAIEIDTTPSVDDVVRSAIAAISAISAGSAVETSS